MKRPQKLAVMLVPTPPYEICGLEVKDANERLDDWLSLPHFHIPDPSRNHFQRLRTSLEAIGTAGNLTTGAHLACLAQERGYLLCSTDADFARFPGLRWKNPFK